MVNNSSNKPEGPAAAFVFRHALLCVSGHVHIIATTAGLTTSRIPPYAMWDVVAGEMGREKLHGLGTVSVLRRYCSIAVSSL